MTTNDATPREAIARAMTSGFSQKVWDGEFNPSPDLDYNRAVREHVRNDFLADADAVIAHIWRMADDPEVVEAIGKRLAQGSLFPSKYNTDEAYRKRARELATGVLEAGLTALIGPRPQGDQR